MAPDLHIDLGFRHMYQRFHHAMGFEQKQSAFLLYRSRAFNQRLGMVDDALKMFLPKHEYEDRWRPLRAEVENLSHTQNVFAHHPVLRGGTSRDGETFDAFCIYIEPYERVLNNEYPGLRGKIALELPDLKQHNAEVEKLIGNLHTFAWIAGALRANTSGGHIVSPPRAKIKNCRRSRRCCCRLG